MSRSEAEKDYVSKTIRDLNLDIVCLQEIDLEVNYPTNILTFQGYDLLVEDNSVKARVGMYISNKKTLGYQQGNDKL